MARTPLTDALRRMHTACAEAERTGFPVDVIAHRQQQRRLRRAEFLAGAGATTLLAACSSNPAGNVIKSAGAPRVLIVGGGLAGTSCAYRLWQAGVPFTLCEANSAFGGRTWTLRNFFSDGQLVEHGGSRAKSTLTEASLRK